MEKINYKQTVHNIRTILEDYLVREKLQSMVIGVSGGIDSALICALAYPVTKKLDIPLIGRSITIQSNSPDEVTRAKEIGSHFCTDFRETDLTNQFFYLEPTLIHSSDHIINIVETQTPKKIRLGNVKARLRMIYLYDIAQKNKGMVLSTDNYTELMLGFWTLHGDVGDYGMVQELWKTEIYGMTEWIAKNEFYSESATKSLLSMLDAVATDGLGITNSDLDQIIPDWKERHETTREGYFEVDTILEKFFNGEYLKPHPVIDRHVKTMFKRNNPLNLKRKDIIK